MVEFHFKLVHKIFTKGLTPKIKYVNIGLILNEEGSMKMIINFFAIIANFFAMVGNAFAALGVFGWLGGLIASLFK